MKKRSEKLKTYVKRVGVTQAADVFGKTRQTIYNWLESGNVTVVHIDGVTEAWRVKKHKLAP